LRGVNIFYAAENAQKPFLAIKERLFSLTEHKGEALIATGERHYFNCPGIAGKSAIVFRIAKNNVSSRYAFHIARNGAKFARREQEFDCYEFSYV
jgi:hypothetical protein